MNGDGQVEFPLVTTIDIVDGNDVIFHGVKPFRGVSIQMSDNGATMTIYANDLEPT